MARNPLAMSGSIAPRTRRRLRLVLPVILALAFPATIFASHQFSDVPTTAFFHTQIGNLEDAGITNGCGGGRYCPEDSVTRAAMAGFLNRGLGRASADDGLVTFAASATDYVATDTITAGGVAGGTGFVTVTGSVTAYTETAGVCPCEVTVRIDRLTTTPLMQSPEMYFGISDAAPPSNSRSGSGTVSWVFPVASGAEQAFGLSATIETTGAGGGNIEGMLTLTYSPVGSAGSSAP